MEDENKPCNFSVHTLWMQAQFALNVENIKVQQATLKSERHMNVWCSFYSALLLALNQGKPLVCVSFYYILCYEIIWNLAFISHVNVIKTVIWL